MAAGLARFFRGFGGVGGILGPSLAKELRSTSRRARHYVLRFVYVSVLALFVAAAWLGWTRPGASVSPLYAASRMSEAGKQIIVWVVWFQFFAAQLAAIVLMSTSVSGEVSRRTLGVLMTTPLTGLQIVMGKLLGGTCQLLGLLAISFPVLAVVRVFGGVPWGYVVAGLCITPAGPDAVPSADGVSEQSHCRVGGMHRGGPQARRRGARRLLAVACQLRGDAGPDRGGGVDLLQAGAEGRASPDHR